MRQQKIWRPLATVWAVLAVLLVVAIAPVAAAGGNGLRVSPVRTPPDLTINPGQTKTIVVTVTNVTASPATLQVVVNDFTASSDESGNPAIILSPNQYAPSHSLKRFVQPIPDFTLQPGQQKAVNVVITIPPGAVAGGYYGAVRFAPAGSGGTDKTVTLAGSVGSLILVKVPGNIKEQLSIASFDARVNDRPSSLFLSNKNITATVRFQNEGNLQEAPFGKVLLKNRSGKILGEYEVNNTDPRGNVLPDSVRKFSVPVSKVGSFGLFKLEGNFGYGVNGQLLSASTTFYVVPVALVIIFVVLVALILFLIFGLPRLIRAYNQRIIRQAGRR